MWNGKVAKGYKGVTLGRRWFGAGMGLLLAEEGCVRVRLGLGFRSIG